MTPEQVVKKQADAYNARNIKEFVACFSEDVQFFNILGNVLRFEGKAKLIEGFTKLFDTSPNLKLEIKNRMVYGDFVVDHEWVTGASSGQNGMEIISINYVKDGLIQKVWFSR